METKTRQVLLDENEIGLFWDKCSFIGALTLYATYSFFKANKGFTFANLGTKVSNMQPDYCYGYFIACSCLGLFTYNINREEKIITITDFEPKLESKISDLIKTKALKAPGFQVSLDEFENLVNR